MSESYWYHIIPCRWSEPKTIRYVVVAAVSSPSTVCAAKVHPRWTNIISPRTQLKWCLPTAAALKTTAVVPLALLPTPKTKGRKHEHHDSFRRRVQRGIQRDFTMNMGWDCRTTSGIIRGTRMYLFIQRYLWYEYLTALLLLWHIKWAAITSQNNCIYPQGKSQGFQDTSREQTTRPGRHKDAPTGVGRQLPSDLRLATSSDRHMWTRQHHESMIAVSICCCSIYLVRLIVSKISRTPKKIYRRSEDDRCLLITLLLPKNQPFQNMKT